MIIEDEANWADDHTWNLIRNGEISVEEAYEAYTDNLRYVLDDVKLVLENTDAETVIISADHGNAFGEWGEFSHGHPYIGAVRNVPWVKTSASDQETHTPDVEALARDSDTPSVDAKLRALGYKT
jgi:membrane-anchored protein YejM (alkaline phosphatase superfamily)